MSHSQVEYTIPPEMNSAKTVCSPSHPTRTQRLQNVVLFLRGAVSRNESAVEALYGESNPPATADEKQSLSSPLRDIDLAIEEIESLANRIDRTTGRVNEAFFYEGD